jgi:hypothetical protein
MIPETAQRLRKLIDQLGVALDEWDRKDGNAAPLLFREDVVWGLVRSIVCENRRAEAVLVRAEGVARFPEGWQPMATAPKDGSSFLVWSSGTGRWPRIARWCESPRVVGGGWFGFDESQLGVESHWMPLPQPPIGPSNG